MLSQALNRLEITCRHCGERARCPPLGVGRYCLLQQSCLPGVQQQPDSLCTEDRENVKNSATGARRTRASIRRDSPRGQRGSKAWRKKK